MKHTVLGKTGMHVSRICLGTMQFGWSADKEMSFKILDKAWDLGINFLDTANIYMMKKYDPNSEVGQSERIIGEWMKKTGLRDELIIATKVRGPMGAGLNDQGLSRRHIRQQVNASLKRLQTKWIDLYQTHWYDDNTDIRETLDAFNDLVHDGTVNAIGCSNFTVWQLVESLWIADKHGLTPFQVLQPNYSLVRREHFENGLLQVCLKYDLGVISYSPLAGGFLTGKYRKDQPLPPSVRAERTKHALFTDKNFKILEVLKEIANNKGITMAQAALAWVLHQPAITAPITGANSPEQLEETVQAVEVSFTAEELKRLNDVSEWRAK